MILQVFIPLSWLNSFAPESPKSEPPADHYSLRIQIPPNRIFRVPIPSEKHRNVGGPIPFLGHIWILRDYRCWFEVALVQNKDIMSLEPNQSPIPSPQNPSPKYTTQKSHILVDGHLKPPFFSLIFLQE